MCGLVGIWETNQSTTEEELRANIGKMTAVIAHRGPNDSGIWVHQQSGIALGHRRLSIIDLSEAGHQPMQSPDGRYQLVYNGEIYNHHELRQELLQRGCSFRGSSDTEVLLHAIAEWGLQKTLPRLNGMFAFAIWDQKKQSLQLVRDRLGIKPLYYGWFGKTFLFASELKSIRQHPHFEANINRDALALFLKHNYIPAPYSIYSGIQKLPQGKWLEVSQATLPHVRIETWWSLQKIIIEQQQSLFTGSNAEAVTQLDQLLSDAIKIRMEADVPLGAFLSGGIDSSLVVALMQKQSSQRVKTFTIGFEEEAFNEAGDAKKIAAHLGTDHTELFATPQDALDVIPQLPALFDEPFADSSQIPTYLVSKMTQQSVTVSLSGDGGDELFCGYNRYFDYAKVWNKLQRIPCKSAMAWLSHLGSYLFRGTRLSNKFRNRANLFSLQNAAMVYQQLNIHWAQNQQTVIGAAQDDSLFSNANKWVDLPDCREEWMWLDAVTYLPDDILVKVDRASMGTSLEARVPLLDHRVVQFAWQLPFSHKVNANKGKLILRNLLAKYVPLELFDRPKKGFGVPIDTWLRGPLRDWAESLLDENRLTQEGFFEPKEIRRKWEEHLSGKCDWHYHLWDVLVFQAWLEGTTKP
ncbi:Asparagine synthetase [glutamine-hydrolyzing] [hydrothermal vent metagenome]|uniref:Asparagine synthetase [glutamine-hydrolyzing] n=1 Tax=hydrothermal vent metagenome TaxID=652676 RepID=A0A3B1DC73_9ZZZZ